MRTNGETPLCRYHYDALDRLDVCTPAEQASTRRFYQKSRLATEIQDLVQHSIFQYDDQLLAQRQRQGGTVATTLLITDQQRSVLNALDATSPSSVGYTPYGHRCVGNGLLSLLGFNGERPDPVTGHYHLGNGYRQFNPVLMRFNSPDSWSPFGKGGINAYAYCAGDPINRADPTGHTLLKPLQKKMMKIGLFETELYDSLSIMINKLGGDKAIKKAATLEGATPEHYLLNRTLDYVIDQSYSTMDAQISMISTSSSVRAVIDEAATAVLTIHSYSVIRGRLNKYPGFLDAQASDKLSVWSKNIQVRVETYRRVHADKIWSLQSAPPPPYAGYAPSAAPQPGDAANSIRQQ